MAANWKNAQRKAANTARWAVTMTKVRIRRIAAKTRWQLVTFTGPSGAESAGILDLVAVRKDHGPPKTGLKRGDLLQIILIQVKGGSAARPTHEDARRMRAVASWHRIGQILLAIWKRGRAVQFYKLDGTNWSEVRNLERIFR